MDIHNVKNNLICLGELLLSGANSDKINRWNL